MAEYFRDRAGSRTCCCSIDKHLRFTQAGSEVSTLLGRMPSAVATSPTLADEMGQAAGAHHLDARSLDHLRCRAILRPRRRPHRPGAGHDVFRAPRTRPTVLSRPISELGIYPAVDPLDSDLAQSSNPRYIGNEHYRVAAPRPGDPAALQGPQDIIAILGSTSSPEEDKILVGRARRIQRFLSQNLFVAEQFTGQPGSFVPVDETSSSFQGAVRGEVTDHLPEQAVLPLRRRRGCPKERAKLAG